MSLELKKAGAGQNDKETELQKDAACVTGSAVKMELAADYRSTPAPAASHQPLDDRQKNMQNLMNLRRLKGFSATAEQQKYGKLGD